MNPLPAPSGRTDSERMANGRWFQRRWIRRLRYRWRAAGNEPAQPGVVLVICLAVVVAGLILALAVIRH